MRPLSLTFQLVLDEHKQLATEIEVIYEDGQILTKRLPANERMTLYFADLAGERNFPSTNPPPDYDGA